MYKTVEEYSKEMTREEFQEFVDTEDICPNYMNLKDDETCLDDCDCWKCWNNALVGIIFKAAVPALPKETILVLNRLAEIEAQYKRMDEERDKLKADLLSAMEAYGVEKWENEAMAVSYIAPTTRNSVDSAKLKKSYPGIYEECVKTSNVKSSVRFKLK